MERLILDIESGADLYGQDYTKAAQRALDDALRHSFVNIFSTLELNQSDMHVHVMISVHKPIKVDDEKITAAIPRGRANVNIVFGGQNIDARRLGQPSEIASCAIEAFIPDMTEHFEIC